MKISKSFYVEDYDDGAFICEAFGIEGGYENVIINDLDIPSEFEILYITGESGCGKSVLMNQIFSETTVDIPSTPLFKWGNDEKSTLEILSMVGLGDATLFISKYNQLSDSQKFRARFAKMIIDGNELIVVDEFLSTLDRKTAKAVAYTIQKTVRKLGIKCVFVTAHDDLDDYLMATYTIKGKAFPSSFKVIENKYDISKNPVTEDLDIKYGDKFIYKENRLGELHYKGKYTGGTKEYLYAFKGEDLVGVVISIYRMHDGGRRISRVVVHPSYRGSGIGKLLIKKYIDDYPNTDTVAAMAIYNPVFERAGMTRVNDSIVKMNPKLKKKLKKLNFNFDKNHSKKYCEEFCNNELTEDLFDEIIKSISFLVCPGGKYLEEDELKEKIRSNVKTRGRLLFNLREKKWLNIFLYKLNQRRIIK